MITTHDSISRQFADFIQNISFEDLSDSIVLYTKERILDTLGVCIAGSYGWEHNKALIESLGCFGLGQGTIVGNKNKASTAVAAMINSAFAQSVELDDGHKNAGVHAGAVVIPAALAVAEQQGSSGKEFLTAVVIGYEIVYRLARHMNPAEIEKGFHPTTTCGTIGAAAAAVKLLKCDTESIAAALGLAGLQASGLMEVTLSAQSSKPVMVGHGALAGVAAAYLAQSGLPGPDQIFEGKSGLFQAMSANVDLQGTAAELGVRLEIVDTYVKMYPTLRHIQPAIEGILSLREKFCFTPEDIQRIIVGTFPIAVKLTGTIYKPESIVRARFSMPFAIAVALMEGTEGLTRLEQHLLVRPDLLDLARLVEVRVDEDICREFPKKRGAKVQVYLKDGRLIEKSVFTLKGSPDLPVSWEELRQKFLACASPVYSEEISAVLLNTIKNIDTLNNISQLTRILSEIKG